MESSFLVVLQQSENIRDRESHKGEGCGDPFFFFFGQHSKCKQMQSVLLSCSLSTYIHGKRAAIVLKLNRRRFVTHPTFLQNGLAAGLKLAPISVPYILPRLFAPSTIPCSPATNLGCFTTSGYITSIFLFQSVWPTVKQSQTSRMMGGSVQY